MDINVFFKSVLDQDKAPIVLCDLTHNIVYINPTAAKRYAAAGGAAMVGTSILNCHNAHSRQLIENCLDWFRKDKNNNIVYESVNETENKDCYIVALRDGDGNLIGYYEKHEYRTRDTGKFYDFA